MASRIHPFYPLESQPHFHHSLSRLCVQIYTASPYLGRAGCLQVCTLRLLFISNVSVFAKLVKVSDFLATSLLLILRHLALITRTTAATRADLTECSLCSSHNHPLRPVLLGYNFIDEMLTLKLSSSMHTSSIDRAGIKPRSEWPHYILLTASLLLQKFQENAPNSKRCYGVGQR